jgi:hypothetical protein
VVAVSEAIALVRRGRDLLARDCESGKEQRLASPLDRFGPSLSAGAMRYVPPFVVKLPVAQRPGHQEPRLLGKAPGPALALSSAGQILVASQPGSERAPAGGPVRWVFPVSVPSEPER